MKDEFGDKNQSLIINMHMNPGIHITLPDRKVQMYDRDFDVYFEYFKNFRWLCKKWIGDADIKIAIENTDGFREYEKTIEALKNSVAWIKNNI